MFQVTVITPSRDTKEIPIEMEDWRVFHNRLYRHFTRSSQEILNEIGFNSITLDDLEELKLGSKGKGEAQRQSVTFLQEIFS